MAMDDKARHELAEKLDEDLEAFIAEKASKKNPEHDHFLQELEHKTVDEMAEVSVK